MDLEGPPPIPGTFEDANKDDSRITFSDEEDQSFDCNNLPIPDHDPSFFPPTSDIITNKTEVSSQPKELVKEDSPGFGIDQNHAVTSDTDLPFGTDSTLGNIKVDQETSQLEDTSISDEKAPPPLPILDDKTSNSDCPPKLLESEVPPSNINLDSSEDPISQHPEVETDGFSSFAEFPTTTENVQLGDSAKPSVAMDTTQINATEFDYKSMPPAMPTSAEPEDEFADFGSSPKENHVDCDTTSPSVDPFATMGKEEPSQTAISDQSSASAVVSNSFPDDGEDDDEFGDFADFEQAEPTKAVSDSEWGDFDSAPRNSRQVSAANLESEEDDDDFGAFGGATNTSETVAKDETDWSADFKQSSSFSTSFKPSFEEDKTEYAALENMDLTTIWDFDDSDDLEEETGKVIHITSEFDCNTVDDTSLTSDDYYHSSCKIWHSLRIVEDSKALEFKWESAVVNSNFLKKLEIDENATPATLQPLSVGNVLLPTPVAASSVSPGSKLAVSPTTLTPSPVFSQASNKENGDNSGSSTVRATTRDNSPTMNLDSLSAPPVDFDWNKSGLTNPLKGGNRSSALLDVDFLSLNSGTTVNSVSTLQKELDALGLSTPTQTGNTSSQQSVLDRLMATTAPTKHNYRPSAELSLDAGALHARLPEIGYLRSKTIMFPIGPTKQSEEQ